MKLTLTVALSRKPATLSKRFTRSDDGNLHEHPGGQLVRIRRSDFDKCSENQHFDLSLAEGNFQ